MGCRAHPDVIGSDGVAAPEGYQNDLAYLKSKVDAGADLIVTQLFYDTDIFLKFVNDCRQIGITCPFVPGIMPTNNYKSFLRMTGFCKTKIPADIMAALEPIKDNEEAVKSYGIHLGTEMCRKILAHGIKTLHLYTLNKEKSTLATLMFMRRRTRDKKLIEEWAVPRRNVVDINERFKMFCQGKLRSSPWSELDGLQPETRIINEQLEKINMKGFLTINSQLTVNGEKSDSTTVGWGGPGGYVYQKAYVEFFCSKEKLNALVDKCKHRPSLTHMAVNKEGSWISNAGQYDVNAVTWGVFPAKQIIQPTIVDPVSFMVWKDEAFEIWSRGWACLYPEGDASRKLLEEVRDSYFLVSLVDNDYVNGDLFTVFSEFE